MSFNIKNRTDTFLNIDINGDYKPLHPRAKIGPFPDSAMNPGLLFLERNQSIAIEKVADPAPVEQKQTSKKVTAKQEVINEL